MFKFAIMVSLLLMVSEVSLARASCQSCGPECMPACGTRYFRSCCFNYLRKKRTEPADIFQSPTKEDDKENQEDFESKNNPYLWIEVPARPLYMKPFNIVKHFHPELLDENNLYENRLKY